jgi:lysophospholipase L1-like esterase
VGAHGARGEICILGDSLSANFTVNGVALENVGYYIRGPGGDNSDPCGARCVVVAQPSEQISGQLSKWNTLSPKGSSTLKTVCILLGINDVLTGGRAAQDIIDDLAALVTNIKAANVGVRVVIMQLLPCKSYIDTNYSGTAAAKYAVWQTVNAAILAGATGAHRAIAYPASLNDGFDSLPSNRDAGDKLHINALGRADVGAAFRAQAA